MIYFILASVLVASATAQNRPSTQPPHEFADSLWIANRTTTERLPIHANGTTTERLPIDANGTTTERLPIDANGDVNLVTRIISLPDENKPFWYLNAKAIEQARGSSPNRGSNFSGNQPVFNRRNQGFGNRFGGSRSKVEVQAVGNSFTVIMNNQLKTYIYDPVTDAWLIKKN